MPAPDLEVSQKSYGRFGEFTAHAVWSQSEADDLDNALLLDQEIISGRYTSVRFALTSLEWTSGETVVADVEFDSMPADSDRIILNITAGSAGEIDWKDHPSGCKSDPQRDAPGNVVVTTRNALPGDELFLKGTYIEKGKQAAPAVS